MITFLWQTHPGVGKKGCGNFPTRKVSPMCRNLTRFVWLPLLAIGLIGISVAQDTDPPAKEKIPAKPDDYSPKAGGPKGPTAKVEKGPFRVEVVFKGTFEAERMTEVSIKPEVWKELTVVKAVESGTQVKKGDVLVTFDTEKIDKAIRDMEVDQRLAELSIHMAELEIPVLEKTTPLDLAAAERQKRQVEEDVEKFMKVDRPLSEETAKFGVKNSRHMLEYQKEELKQLEKMYRSKDLTEETEEIILKRQRNQVESAEFMLKMAENRAKQTLEVDLPRREQDLKDSRERIRLTYEKTNSTLPLTLNQKKLGLEKAKYERARAAEKMQNIKQDRELLTVKVPVDGIVYFGKSVQGNWTSATAAAKLHKGGNVMPEEAFMTILQARPVFVRGTVEEKDSRLFEIGAACKIIAHAFPDTKFEGKVEKLAEVPVGGVFEVRVGVDPKDMPRLLPGMTCSVKIVPYLREEALTLPTAALFNDDVDDDKFFVYRVGKDGKPEKKSVTVGKKYAGKAEVLSGLKAGDEVSLTKP